MSEVDASTAVDSLTFTTPTGASSGDQPRHPDREPPRPKQFRTRAAERDGVRQSTHRLYERSESLAEIRNLLSGTWEYPRSPILIEGLTGTGKTALLNASLEIGNLLGLRVGRARCDAAESSAQFGVVRQLFASIYRQTMPEASTNDGTELARRVLRDGLSTTDDPNDAYYSLLLLLETTGAEPALLGIDDVQWADPMSAGWLQFLARRLTTASVHMVLTTRARRTGLAAPSDPLMFNPATRRFIMHPLGIDSTMAMINQHLGCEIDPALAARAHEVTGGNPLLIARMLGALDELGTPAPKITERQIGTLASPMVARSVLSLVANLAPGAAELLEAVAVLGEAELRTAAAVADLDNDVTARLADVLADNGLLSWERPLQFVHSFERHSVYAAIQPARRTRLHRRAARILAQSPDDLAESTQHLLETDPNGDEWIASALVEAARHQLEWDDPEQAAALLQRADREMPGDAARAEIARLRAHVDGLLGRETAVEHLDRAARLGADPIELAETALDLLDQERNHASCATILDLVQPAFDTLVVEHPQLALRLLLAESVLVPASARSRGGCSTVELGDEPMSTPAGRLLAVERVLRSAARMESTHGELIRALPPLLHLEVLRGAGLVQTAVIAAALAALVRVGAYEVADPLICTAINEAESAGRRGDATAYTVILSESLAMQGRVTAADQALAEVNLDGADVVTQCAAMQVRFFAALRERGGHDPIAPNAIPPSFAPGLAELGTAPAMFLSEVTARVQALEGDLVGALANWDRLAAAADHAAIRNPSFAPWRAGRCAALGGLGRAKDGAVLAAENLQLARAFGSPTTVAEALACVARFQPPEAQVDLLTEAVALLVGTKAELLRCNLLIDLGFARHFAGDAAAARTAFRDGADHAARLGVTRLAGVAGRGLLACGARPRRLQMSGLESLTPAEMRVVKLAADGQTNVAIATSLYINLKTVESHLTRAYKKLGISDRAELRAALARKQVGAIEVPEAG